MKPFIKEIDVPPFSLQDKDTISEVLNLAIVLHRDQKKRFDGPYIDHITRVFTTCYHLFGIHDMNVLIAALLHDAVEDQCDELVKLSGNTPVVIADTIQPSRRQQAFAYIVEQYGLRAAQIVSLVTNPEKNPSLNQQEKNEIYRQHIEHLVTDPQAFYVKLADFMDNSLKIAEIPNRYTRTKLAEKYFAIYGIFIKRIMETDILLDTVLKLEIIAKLVTARRQAKQILTHIRK